MPRSASKHPTELELQILKILWNRGPLPVRDVRHALLETYERELAHTSVVTTLRTMERKKYLTKQAVGNAYIFETAVTREEVSKGMLGEVVDQVFDGSATSLVLSLLGTGKVTDEEHRELRELINKQRKTKGEQS